MLWLGRMTVTYWEIFLAGYSNSEVEVLGKLPSYTANTQHVEWDLNKTSKTLTQTLTALFLMEV